MAFRDYFKKKPTQPVQTVIQAPKRKAPTVRNAFQASQVSRLTANWYKPLLSANKELQYDLKRLRSISRWLANNDVYTARYLTLMQTHLVGPQGIVLQPRIGASENKPNDKVNHEILSQWKEWGKAASLDTQLSFIDLEQLAIRVTAMDGEIFFRFIKGPKLNKYGFALMPVDADLLDVDYTDKFAPNGNIIVQGVEQTLQGVPVAYWFWSRNPNDVATTLPLNRVRVPAEEVIHIYRTNRAGQTRGLPWITPAMFSLGKLHEYLDAEIVAAQMAASTVATIETAAGDASNYLDPTGYSPEHLNVEAGVALRLAPGEKFTAFNSPHPTTAFKAFIETMLMGIASALNIAYGSLASDPSKDSYASGRLGAIEQRDYFRNLQTWFSRNFHEAVYKMWLECAIENKAIELPTDNPEDYYEVIFRPRGWAWADPKKDADGVQTLIALNMKSKTQLCAEQGLDYHDVVKDRFAEEKLERQMEKDLIDLGLPATLSSVDASPIKQTVTERIEDAPTSEGTEGTTDENLNEEESNNTNTNTESEAVLSGENNDGEQE